MTKKLLLTSIYLFAGFFIAFSQQNNIFSGTVTDENDEKLIGATIYFEELGIGSDTDVFGNFLVSDIPDGRHTVVVSYVGYQTASKEIDFRKGNTEKEDFCLQEDGRMLLEVEVFGVRRERPEKMEALTRIPLRLDEQVQSVSVVSQKMITEQGALTLNDAVRNAPGLGTFATYGNTSESITSRGYRGIPVVKNGVRVHSDFRGRGFLSDMQGVETIQVLRGSASIAQGMGNDIGSGGGVVNIATKTPRFINAGNIGLRAGSWGQFRPTFDIQRVLDAQGKSAFRINGAYERADNYRVHVSKDRFYVNPSFAWHPDHKTKLVLEMDYMHDSRTPDQGTVNLSADSVNNIYAMPFDNFLGFSTDRQINNTFTYMAHLNRELGNGFSVRVAYAGSAFKSKDVRAHASSLKSASRTGEYNLRSRRYSASGRDDTNGVFQLDLMGKDIFTGPIKHTFNVGFDYRWSDVSTVSTNAVAVDTVDVLKPIPNVAPQANLVYATPVTSQEYAYGLLLQEVMTFNKYLKVSLGLRYSQVSGLSNNTVSNTGGDVWDPLFGIIVTPFNDFNVFASYTTTTSLRGAGNLLEDRITPVGPTREKQFETGLKSEWFDNRLRFSATYFHIKNNNLTYATLDEAGNNTGYYVKAGNLKREGIELELSGKLLKNMDVVLGYSYLDAAYHDSPYYHEGSSPMNTANHTANGWLNYTVFDGILRNLSFGLGAYFVGERPFAEYTHTVLPGHNVQANTPPFMAKPYTTLNLQMGYRLKNYQVRVFANNLLNSVGYTAYYRGGYLNPTDPRNFAVALNYQF
ncbi:MAG: TonB-dependent receptor [Bacteroidia bacterium]|nr:TonB-dependent receptor [Bacteroidia bacterium]